MGNSQLAMGPLRTGRNSALAQPESTLWPVGRVTIVGPKEATTKAEVSPLVVTSTSARKTPPRTSGPARYDWKFPGAGRGATLARTQESASGGPRHRTAALGAP